MIYNQTSKYWFILMKLNENDFKGKNIKLVNYSSNIKSYRFEIRENAELVSDGTIHYLLVRVLFERRS